MKRYRYPDEKGFFGKFGGSFVPETLNSALEELKRSFFYYFKKKEFQAEYQWYLKNYVGRPSLLYYAKRLSKKWGIKLYLKREDLNHTGAHKINNTIGQALLAKKMGKTRIIAETGAGQHGVATATACALFGIKCEIYMGREDIHRQALNVFRMNLLGANVIEVKAGSQTLKDAMNEAIRDWVTNIDTTFYLIGSVAGPHPYPLMVREFQSVIGKETKQQIKKLEGRLPDTIIACVGGGSNAMGIFHPFINDKVELIGVEAAGEGLNKKHAATLCKGRPGILHGSLSFLLQDKFGQVKIPHSVAAGLDYPGVGPEHAYLKEIGRAKYFAITDKEALEACKELSETEGIIPALESAHAIAYAKKYAKKNKGKLVVVNLSGRGDKDMDHIWHLMKHKK